MNKTFTEYEPMKNIVNTTSGEPLGQIVLTVPIDNPNEQEDLLDDILDRMDILESKLDTLLKICDRISRNI